MLKLGKVDDYHWRFRLVIKGAQRMFLRESGSRTLKSLGTPVEDFQLKMALGDAVYVQRHGRRPQLMFRLGTHPQRRYATIKYGEGWGSAPGQYRKLDDLSPNAFANAGLEPAKGAVQ